MRWGGRGASAGSRGAEALCDGRGGSPDAPAAAPLPTGQPPAWAGGRKAQAAGKRRRPDLRSLGHCQLEPALSPPSAAGRAGFVPPLRSGTFSFRFSFTF